MKDTNYKGKFMPGFLIGLMSYVVNGILGYCIEMAINLNKYGCWFNNYDQEQYGLILGFIFTLQILAFIWVPISIISGIISKFVGIKATLWFVEICFVAILIFWIGSIS